MSTDQSENTQFTDQDSSLDPSKDKLDGKYRDAYERLLATLPEKITPELVTGEEHKFAMLAMHAKETEVNEFRKANRNLILGLVTAIIVAGGLFGAFTYYWSAYRILQSDIVTEQR